MDDYVERVSAAAAAADGKDMLRNRTTAHAAVLIAALFSKATRSVEILCEDLNDKVYGRPNVLAAALAYLRGDEARSLHIIVEEDVPVEESAFLRRLRADNLLSRVELRRMPKKFQDGHSYNFMIADGVHYRYEPDRAKCEAVALFGNKEDGAFLNSAFDSFKAVSPIVALA